MEEPRHWKQTWDSRFDRWLDCICPLINFTPVSEPGNSFSIRANSSKLSFAHERFSNLSTRNKPAGPKLQILSNARSPKTVSCVFGNRFRIAKAVETPITPWPTIATFILSFTLVLQSLDWKPKILSIKKWTQCQRRVNFEHTNFYK